MRNDQQRDLLQRAGLHGLRLAVVLGSSADALSELDAARAFLTAHDLALHVICVNGAIRICPVRPFAFATVFSPEEAGERFLTGIDLSGVRLFARRAAPSVAFTAVKPKWHGSSGLYAAQIALEELGFDGVILAGCPMDAAAGALCQHSEMGDPTKVDRFKPEWARALPEISGRIRSMSGWTRDLLGAPSGEWLAALALEATPPPAPAAR